MTRTPAICNVLHTALYCRQYHREKADPAAASLRIFSLATEKRGESFARVTVPKRGDGSLLGVAGKYSQEFGTQFVWIASDENVRSHGHRNRALGLLAERQARNAEVGGLFLDATGVGNHDGCTGLHAEELQIGQRVKDLELVRMQSEIGNALSCPRVRGEYN